MKHASGVALLALCVAGCQSARWGPYTSPRITGQVVAAGSQTPLSGVSVSRGRPDRRFGAWPPKGAELMLEKAPVRTDEKGEFVLASERVLSVFRGSEWNQVRLRFEKPGYLTLQTNYPIILQTNVLWTEPRLTVGQVSLQPAVK